MKHERRLFLRFFIILILLCLFLLAKTEIVSAQTEGNCQCMWIDNTNTCVLNENENKCASGYRPTNCNNVPQGTCGSSGPRGCECEKIPAGTSAGTFGCVINHAGMCLPKKNSNLCQSGFKPDDCSRWSNIPTECTGVHDCVPEGTEARCVSRSLWGCPGPEYPDYSFDCSVKSRCCRTSEDCERAGEQGERMDFGQLSGAIPGLKSIFQPGPASNVGAIISTVLPYLFVIAGLLLLFYLIAGGFQMMTAANDEKGLVGAKGKITNALVGFLLLFVSYWIVQIIEYILGIKIF